MTKNPSEILSTIEKVTQKIQPHFTPEELEIINEVLNQIKEALQNTDKQPNT